MKFTIELADEIAQRFVINTLGLGAGGASANSSDVTGYVMVVVRDAIQAQPHTLMEERLKRIEEQLDRIMRWWTTSGGRL